MAIPLYGLRTTGTALSIKASGGDYVITLTSLANGSARQSAKIDLGANWAQGFNVHVAASVAVAATNGNMIEYYWAASQSATAGTDNAGGTSGSDAALSNPSELKLQLILIGFLSLSNATGTSIQRQCFTFVPPTRYGMIVVINSSGQALGSTATDHEVRLVPVPPALATGITG